MSLESFLVKRRALLAAREADLAARVLRVKEELALGQIPSEMFSALRAELALRPEFRARMEAKLKEGHGDEEVHSPHSD